MKINYGILGKAIWEVLVIPVAILVALTVFGIAIVATMHFFGKVAVVIMVSFMLVGGYTTVLIKWKYDDLITDYTKRREQIIDRLRN